MKNTSKNPNNPLKRKLAARFLNALNHLTPSPSLPPSMAEKSRRHRAIRAAAYASMASAVGPRKAWSRALLKKIRSHKVMMNIHGKRRRRRRRRRKNPSRIDGEGTRFGHEGLKDLSELVPGGEAMNSCKLLNEAGHYICCLRAQVQIMRRILDSSSSTTL